MVHNPADASGDSSIDWRGLFTSLDGRISRKPFWVGVVVLFVVSIPIQLFVVTLGGDVAGLIVSLALLYPSFAVNVKRAHDRNRPAWVIGLFYIVLILLVLLQLADPDLSEGRPSVPFTLVGLAFVLFAIALTIDLGFLRGTPGTNRFGRDPLART